MKVAVDLFGVELNVMCGRQWRDWWIVCWTCYTTTYNTWNDAVLYLYTAEHMLFVS